MTITIAPIDFARKSRRGGKRPKKCSTGTRCGATCISRKRNCTTGKLKKSTKILVNHLKKMKSQGMAESGEYKRFYGDLKKARNTLNEGRKRDGTVKPSSPKPKSLSQMMPLQGNEKRGFIPIVDPREGVGISGNIYNGIGIHRPQRMIGGPKDKVDPKTGRRTIAGDTRKNAGFDVTSMESGAHFARARTKKEAELMAAALQSSGLAQLHNKHFKKKGHEDRQDYKDALFRFNTLKRAIQSGDEDRVREEVDRIRSLDNPARDERSLSLRSRSFLRDVEEQGWERNAAEDSLMRDKNPEVQAAVSVFLKRRDRELREPENNAVNPAPLKISATSRKKAQELSRELAEKNGGSPEKFQKGAEQLIESARQGRVPLELYAKSQGESLIRTAHDAKAQLGIGEPEKGKMWGADATRAERQLIEFDRKTKGRELTEDEEERRDLLEDGNSIEPVNSLTVGRALSGSEIYKSSVEQFLSDTGVKSPTAFRSLMAATSNELNASSRKLESSDQKSRKNDLQWITKNSDRPLTPSEIRTLQEDQGQTSLFQEK